MEFKKIVIQIIFGAATLSLSLSLSLPLPSLQSMAMADVDFSKEIVKATSLTSSLYMIEGAGGNMTALIGAEGTLLVDDDFAPMAQKLIAKLKELKGASPRFVINTHFHYDHTGGNEIFGPQALVIAATEVRNRLMTEQTLWHERHQAYPSQALPTLTFDHQLTLHLNGEDIKVMHLPHGHTDGDSVVFFSHGKVISMGDLYFSGMYPIFHPEHNGSLSGLIQNIESVLREASSDAQIVPGHGPLSTKAELERYHQMILDSVAAVKGQIRSGQSLNQILKKGLPKKWESFSHGYRSTDQWLTAVFESLKGHLED